MHACSQRQQVLLRARLPRESVPKAWLSTAVSQDRQGRLQDLWGPWELIARTGERERRWWWSGVGVGFPEGGGHLTASLPLFILYACFPCEPSPSDCLAFC